jgi:uncharacterized membrane protein (UPF0182 family)
VQSLFNSDPAVAEKIKLLKGGDSTVEYGNLLTIPLDGGLLYVEPVYLRGADTNYPLLKRVLVHYGDDTAFETTLSEALNAVFGVDSGGTTSPPDTGTGDGDGTTTPPTDSTVAQALEDAQKAYDAGQKALQSGDWVAYGEAQKDLADALKRAQAAEKAAEKTG